MKAIINAAMLAFAFLAAAACTGKQEMSPAQKAVAEKIAQSAGADAVITFTVFEKVDSTTFGQELEHRKQVFRLRLQQNLKYYEQFTMEGKPISASAKKADKDKDILVLRGLEEIGKRMADSLDLTAYFDYRFSGSAKSGDGTLTFTDYYASITPDGKLMNLTDSQKGLHIPLGRVLPGYLELIEDDEP